MPTDPAEILPQLLLGSRLVAQDRGALDQHKITHVLNTAHEIPNYYEGMDGNTPVYKHLELKDDAEDNIQAEFEPCACFIDDAVEAGGRCLVHCQAGISRSATIVIAYLMCRRNMSLRDAFLHVKSLRENIGPNEHFMAVLAVLEDSLRPPEERGAPPSLDLNDYYLWT
eukprot:11946025-Ditylum_brightwellii.AAC.1